MAAVYKEVLFTWKGVTYRITPSYPLIQRFEQRLSIFSMLMRLGAGENRMSELACLLAMALDVAGAKEVDEAEVYEVMHEDVAVFKAATDVLKAVQPRHLGKAKGPSGAQPQATSTGPSTTESPSASSGSPPASSGG